MQSLGLNCCDALVNGCLIVCTFLLRRLDDCDIGEDLIPKRKDYLYYHYLLLIKSIKTRDKSDQGKPFIYHTLCPVIFNKHVLLMLRCMKCFQVVCATKTFLSITYVLCHDQAPHIYRGLVREMKKLQVGKNQCFIQKSSL